MLTLQGKFNIATTVGKKKLQWIEKNARGKMCSAQKNILKLYTGEFAFHVLVSCEFFAYSFTLLSPRRYGTKWIVYSSFATKRLQRRVMCQSQAKPVHGRIVRTNGKEKFMSFRFKHFLCAHVEVEIFLPHPKRTLRCPI